MLLCYFVVVATVVVAGFANAVVAFSEMCVKEKGELLFSDLLFHFKAISLTN
jgi:hypothetical protein